MSIVAFFLCATVFQTLQKEKTNIAYQQRKKEVFFSFYFVFLTSHLSLLVLYIYI